MADDRIKIVFPHIPKTGGTTLMYHFRKHFGDDRVFVLGPSSRVQRFMSNQPQYEDLPEQDLDRLRVILGHGVDEQTLRVLDRDRVRLLVVWRHPLGLTRSRYNHKYNEMKRRGLELASRRFLRVQPNDFVTTSLLDKFPGLIDPSAKLKTQQVRSVLRHFAYVFTTEQLDNQSRLMFTSLGLPTELERRRVAESRRELEADDSAILRRNGTDLKIFAQCNVVLEGDGSRHNPFGLPRRAPGPVAGGAATRGASEAVAIEMENGAAGDAPTTERPASPSHAALIRALCGTQMAEVALARIEADPATVAMPRLDEFRDALAAAWAESAARLPAPLRNHSASNLAAWKARNSKRLVT